MGNHLDILGTTENSLQIELDGVQIVHNAGVAEIKNADKSALARLKAAAPVDDNDIVNFITFKTKKGNIIVKDQADTSGGLPTNTTEKRFLVVTTPGSGANILDLLYDDGSNSGNMQIIPADDGRTIFTTQAFSGGNVELVGEAIYGADVTTTSWVLQSTVGDATGGERVIEYTVGQAATTDSAQEIPANAKIFRREVEVTQVYSAGSEIEVGHEGDTDLLIASTSSPKRIKPQQLGTYIVTSAVSWGGTQRKVRTTVTNTPAQGQATIRVWYAVPNN